MDWIIITILLTIIITVLWGSMPARLDTGKVAPNPSPPEEPQPPQPPTPAPQQKRKRGWKLYLVQFIFFFSLTSLTTLAEYYCMLPGQDREGMMLMIGLLVGFSVFITILLILCSLVGLIFERTRRDASTLLLGCFMYLFCIFFWGRVSAHIRDKALLAFTERSKVLINAIKAYESDHGKPPAELKNLVPQYLPKVPDTGIRAYPKYEYMSGDQAENIYHNPWVLNLYCGECLLDFHVLTYRPKQNENSWGRIRMIGDWEYIDYHIP